MDILNQIVEINTVAGIIEPPPSSNSSTSNILSNGDEDSNERTISGRNIWVNHKCTSIICKKDKETKKIATKIASHQAALTRQESKLRKVYRDTESKHKRKSGDGVSSGDDEDAPLAVFH